MRRAAVTAAALLNYQKLGGELPTLPDTPLYRNAPHLPNLTINC